MDKLSGSRTFCWRLFLGLLPPQHDKAQWVVTTQEKRQLFYKKMTAIMTHKELSEHQHKQVEELLMLQL